MPQLMPLFWVSSVILLILLLMVLVFLYNYYMIKINIMKNYKYCNMYMFMW